MIDFPIVDTHVHLLDQKRFNSRQIDYVSLVVQELTENGTVETRRFFDSPFTDLSPTGPDSLFTGEEISDLINVLGEIRRTAAA